MRYALVVLGMHRSGTSALTRVLSCLGAQLPKTPMPEAPGNNELGFFESQPIAAAHDEFLAFLGSRWDNPSAIPKSALESPQAHRLVDDLERIVKDEFRDAPLFVLKDPRASRLVPIWLQVFQRLSVETRFVVCLRNPTEVAASLATRDKLGSQHATLLWLSHTLEAERHTRGHPRSFVTYEQLLTDWSDATTRVGRQLGISWPRPTTSARLEVESFLTSRLRHHAHSPPSKNGHLGLLSWSLDLYQLLQRAASEGTVDETAVDNLASQLFQAQQGLDGVVAELFSQRLALDRANAQQQIEYQSALQGAQSQKAMLEAQHSKEGQVAEEQAQQLRVQLATSSRELEAALGRIAQMQEVQRELTLKNEHHQSALKELADDLQRSSAQEKAHSAELSRLRQQVEQEQASLGGRVLARARRARERIIPTSSLRERAYFALLRKGQHD